MLMANELPEDLETEILLWLPVASLLRFKCVCKPGGREAEIYVAGSCNGLVCLHDSGALCVVIWNPATNETKVVPKSYLPRNAPAGYRTTVESMGFGFDAKTNDYKIINVRSFRHPSIIQSENIFQTEVYSLSADSWRKVDGPPCLSMIVLKLRGNTSMGWLLVSHEQLGCKFSEVYFDIWLLLEVGVKDSWTKLSTIGPLTEIKELLGFWKNETMLLEKCDGQLVLYDPSTKEMTNLQIHEDRYLLQLVTYTETLVSVKG
ncbi:hypothetical protein SLA2020_527600 [Shorea laevis]